MPFSTPSRRRGWFGVLLAFSLLVVANTIWNYHNGQWSKNRDARQEEKIQELFARMSEQEGAYVRDNGPDRIRTVEQQILRLREDVVDMRRAVDRERSLDKPK